MKIFVNFQKEKGKKITYLFFEKLCSNCFLFNFCVKKKSKLTVETCGFIEFREKMKTDLFVLLVFEKKLKIWIDFSKKQLKFARLFFFF